MLFNYIMNPFDIFKDTFPQNHPYLHLQQGKYYNIKFRADKTKYEKVFAGGSPVFFCFEKILPEKEFMCWAYVTNIKFLTSALKDFIEVHPTVKEVYFCFDLSLFINRDSYIKDYQKEITLRELFDFLYSYTTLKYSIKQLDYNIFLFTEMIKEKIKNKNEPPKDYWYEYKRVFPYNKPRYDKLDIIYSFFDEIDELKQFCNDRGIKIKFCVMPYHALLLSKFSRTGDYERYEEFKRIIAKHTDFIDFSYVNEYSSVPFPKDNSVVNEFLFFDIEHSYDFIGRKIVERMNGVQNNYGREITSNNVEKILQKEREELDVYMKANEAYIDDYILNSQSKKDFSIWVKKKHSY